AGARPVRVRFFLIQDKLTGKPAIAGGLDRRRCLTAPASVFLPEISAVGIDREPVGAAVDRQHRDAAEGILPFACYTRAAETVADFCKARDAPAQHAVKAVAVGGLP